MSEQLGFAAMFLDQRLGSNAKLEQIDSLIDWTRLAAIVTPVRSGETGRPPYAALSMLKALYLQALYDLSDPALEEALLDRLSFRRFCGFGLDAGTPDETTICRFRAALAGAGLLEACFQEVNRQLEARGLVLKKGTLMDASIVAARHNPPPRDAGMGAAHPREPGADWTNKNGRSYFGYKLHIGIDEGSGIVRQARFTPARTADSAVADALVSGDEAAVYADRAYDMKARRNWLRAAGIQDRLMHRANKHHPKLPFWKQRRNQLIARRRAPVEAVFSAMKRLYGKARARCHSLERNAADFFAFLTIFNLRRVTLKQA
jgi:IS5 family transposase